MRTDHRENGTGQTDETRRTERLSVVRLVFFSGTGCTAHVADTFRAQLQARGSLVQMHELRRGVPVPQGDYDYLILCYAVHAANAPHPVREWIKYHQTVSRIPAAVISVSGGGEVTPNWACRVAVKRRLRRKGFIVEYEKMLVMPSNWIIPTKPILAARLLEVLPGKTAFIIEELAAGIHRKTRAGFGNRFLSLLGKLETPGARKFGERIEADETCNGCGICFRECPVGNITMTGDRPVFGTGCILCLNCLYRCPRKALHPGTAGFVVIEEGFDLKKIQSAPPGAELLDVAKETKGFLWLGVRRYLLSREDMRKPPGAP